LQELDLGGNSLQAVPPALGTATALRSLRLEHNRLMVSIADLVATLGRMPHLTKLGWGPYYRAPAQQGGMKAVKTYLTCQLAHVKVKYLPAKGYSYSDLADEPDEDHYQLAPGF
jgi:hypothetical protein